VKKWVKITIIVLSILLLIAAGVYAYLYYTYKVKYVPSENKFAKKGSLY
tara:strand:- start:3218 stop:3364 length:147 start_codon:yes stop_codon:yes gene_type:complete